MSSTSTPHEPADGRGEDGTTGLDVATLATLVTGAGFWSTAAVPGAGIGRLLLADGPHGLRHQAGSGDHLGLHDSSPATCFPTAAAVGSSWDPDVARAIGDAVAREASVHGVGVVLGPGVNIKRSPLCGRNFEYLSEDPLLSGVLGAAFVRGLQDRGVGASVKHFAANNQETERMRISAEVDERTLREIYLPAFERIVTEARPATVMCSYNKVNGTYAAQNHRLLTGLLREEWGFDGLVVSDWGAVSDRVAALAAGLDLEMPGIGDASATAVTAAVERGELDPAVLRRSAARVAALAARYGGDPQPGAADPDVHHDLARRLATECAVLLRNENRVLPLADGLRVAALGPFAATARYQGGGSSHVNATRVETALDGVRALAADRGVEVEHAVGTGGDAERAEAVRIAGAADVAIVFAGLAESDESEGFDRSTLELPADQQQLIREVAAVAPRTVVVLVHGGVLTMEGWHDDVDAILDAWLAGQAGGGAIADLLFGVAVPSGRLAETIPLRLQDTPSYLTFPGELGVARYGEGVFVGYRHHVSTDGPVRYPFGYGLSYTTFGTGAPEVRLTGADTAEVTVRVRNTGERGGKHVVQVYVAAPAGPVRRPVRELRAFTKVELDAGEEREVVLALDRRAFAYWDVTVDRFVVPGGRYRIQVCADAATVLGQCAVELTGDPVPRELTLESTVGEWFGHPAVGPRLAAAMAAAAGDREPGPDAGDDLRMVESMPMGRFVAFLGRPFPDGMLDGLMELSSQETPGRPPG